MDGSTAIRDHATDHGVCERVDILSTIALKVILIDDFNTVRQLNLEVSIARYLAIWHNIEVVLDWVLAYADILRRYRECRDIACREVPSVQSEVSRIDH